MSAEQGEFVLSESSSDHKIEKAKMPRPQRDHSLRAGQPSDSKGQTAFLILAASGALAAGAFSLIWQQRKRRNQQREAEDLPEPVDVGRLLRDLNIQPPQTSLTAPAPLAGLKFLLSQE